MPLSKTPVTFASRLNRRGVLTRALGVCMTLAAVLGFLSVSYNQTGCVSYEQVIKNRYFLVQNGKEQLQGTGEWIVSAVFLWCIVVLIFLVALRTAQANRHDKT